MEKKKHNNRAPKLLKFALRVTKKSICLVSSQYVSTCTAVSLSSNRIQSVSQVDLLPHHRPTDAKEIPQVAEHATVEWVILVATVLQVRDPVT